jgi:ParB family transcriptional regulator, chromosome partitioning protein
MCRSFIGNPNPVKLGRCIKELERIYGIRQGQGQKPNNSVIQSQSDLADMLGVSRFTIQNYKKLTELIPEIVDLVDTEIVTPTTALSIER